MSDAFCRLRGRPKSLGGLTAFSGAVLTLLLSTLQVRHHEAWIFDMMRFHFAWLKNLDAACDAMTCSGHGICMNGECVCDRLYSGEICQNEGS